MKTHLLVRRCAISFALITLAILAVGGRAQAGERLFAQAREASGGSAWDRIGSVAAVGVEQDAGMAGAWREVDDLRSPRLMKLQDYSIVRTLEIWKGPDHWRQRSAGGGHSLNSAFGRENAMTDEWLAQRSYLKSNDGGAKLGSVAPRTEGILKFDVVTATPRGGQPVELWFDAATHLLAQTVRQQNLNVETIRYGDYRMVGGAQFPFLITTDDGDPTSLDTVQVTSYALNAATEADFERPRGAVDSAINGGKTTTPIVFDGDVIVEAKINGKGPFGFILDTGGHDILTPAAAEAIGLTLEGAGRSGGAGVNKVSEQYARVARLDIGGMTMRNQVFTIIPMSYATVEQGAGPPLAGILGLEIFERFAVRIDYRAQMLTLQPLDSYVHAGPGRAVPIFFNDDEPLLEGKLEGHAGDFGIDTGNSGSLVVQGHWAEREGLTARLKTGLEVVGFGMGGVTHNWASRVDLEFAGAPVRHVIGRLATDKAGAFASVVEATNVGNDVLANFVLDFDYARGRIWFEPVPGFSPSPFNRSGLGFTKTRPDAVSVVQVSQNTPASDAGLQAGDEIDAIGGVAVDQMSGRDIGRALRKPAGTMVQLSVLRKDRPLSATLALRELLP